jgi:hypothetical protein
MTRRRFLNLKSFDATDLIALTIITGGFGLMAYHVDTVVGGIVIMVVTFYFGNKLKK